MSNKRCQRLFFSVLTIVWMVVIFCFSSDNAEQSSSKSLGIGQTIARVLVPDFDEWTTEKQEEWVEGIEYPIRKTGHAAEYAVLGFLCMGTARSWLQTGRRERNNKIVVFLAWFAATLYAASDEIHQLFVPGRSGQLSDVILDSIGALVGIGLCMLTLQIRRYRGIMTRKCL